VCQIIGLFATFEKGKLTTCHLAENSEESSTRATCDAFAVKYGKPWYRNKDRCMWSYENQDGDTEQILSVETSPSKIGGQVAVFTHVLLFTTLQSKDIWISKSPGWSAVALHRFLAQSKAPWVL
jgi:hypothetical protein